jgi:hypothetical protein
MGQLSRGWRWFRTSWRCWVVLGILFKKFVLIEMENIIVCGRRGAAKRLEDTPVTLILYDVSVFTSLALLT